VSRHHLRPPWIW